MEKQMIGWEEWCCLPALAIPRIKCKIDTGAKTSSLDAKDIEIFQQDGKEYARFVVPLKEGMVSCVAPVVGWRTVTTSGGAQQRVIITTLLEIGEYEFPIELSLTNRENLAFRMLIGREALRGRFVVDPIRSCCCISIFEK